MTELWDRIDEFVDTFREAPPEILMAHGVHLLAVRRFHASGMPVPKILAEADRANTFRHLAGRSLLQRIRSLLDGPMVLIKGPEVAAHYPSPTLRPYGDLDLLVPDSAHAKSVLLANGFEEVPDYEFPHSQLPLRYPGLPLLIELHHHLPWLRWMTAPPPQSFIANAIPGATQLDGIDTLQVTDHLMLIAAHSWKHVPMRRLSDFIDIAVLAEGHDPSELQRRADAWGLGNVWRTMYRTSGHLLTGEQDTSVPLRLLTRHLDPPRDRTVAETHFARWTGAFWAPTPMLKVQSFVGTITKDMRPLPGEPWREKLKRTGWALREPDHPAMLPSREPGENRS